MKLSMNAFKVINSLERQEGRSMSRLNLNENLNTLHLAPTQFLHLPGFYPKTGFLRTQILCPYSKGHFKIKIVYLFIYDYQAIMNICLPVYLNEYMFTCLLE